MSVLTLSMRSLKSKKNSGSNTHEFLAQTSVQDRPGIGAVFNPTVLGVNLNGIFVGIEADGYVHS